MQARLAYSKAAPGAYKAMLAFNDYGDTCGLELSLLDLVKTRASQINGCAYCLDMHYKDARASGETEQRLFGLDAWRESPYYTERERAALALTEAVTLITDGHVPDDVYEQAKQQFSDEELMNLVTNIIIINAWNRYCITFRSVPGAYQSDRVPSPVAAHA